MFVTAFFSSASKLSALLAALELSLSAKMAPKSAVLAAAPIEVDAELQSAGNDDVKLAKRALNRMAGVQTTPENIARYLACRRFGVERISAKELTNVKISHAKVATLSTKVYVVPNDGRSFAAIPREARIDPSVMETLPANFDSAKFILVDGNVDKTFLASA